ncbi:hypothetical protein BO99DRAFT_402779 [Aspergillus violaceofuscus CBS 115571]|uniref:Uncharacterized protein n=1 Tax=Aspergillus violaceofuscus (strain CBS 115571) TaxID=1450538 RepID=A0A2V5II41_ASPV1|nr:hypothetical protein BO99DRAFT_402779 [Aspergillus violaceofuscus CBS 115571]
MCVGLSSGSVVQLKKGPPPPPPPLMEGGVSISRLVVVYNGNGNGNGKGKKGCDRNVFLSSARDSSRE